MAAITRNDLGANVLQTWLNRKTLEVLEPSLYFWKFGEKPMVEDGYNTIAWAKFDQIAASSVTAGDTSDDGVTPSDTDFDASVISVTPVQYRIVVSLSDMVIERNVISFLEGAAKAVGDAMARKIDTVIQTEIMAGTNVLTTGSNAARTDIGSTEYLVAEDLNRASAFLEAANAPHFDGGAYVAVAHPFVIHDLRSVSSAGSWMDSTKYAAPEQLFKGEIGMFCGVRVVMCSNIQTFASTTTVYPTLVLGKGAYGVSSFQSLQTYVTSAVPSDSDPLAQRRKVGAKVAFAAKRLQENCMVRLESAASSLASSY
jgi:N4-gp56 family major capsid protein